MRPYFILRTLLVNSKMTLRFIHYLRNDNIPTKSLLLDITEGLSLKLFLILFDQNTFLP